MFTKDALLAMHAWSHDSLERLFAHVATLPEELQARELEGFGMPSVLKQLAHMLACERFWMRCGFGMYEPWTELDTPTLPELAAERASIVAQTRIFIDNATDAELNTLRRLDVPGHGDEQASPAQLLFHVLTHHFHHKGQAVAMCRILGYPAGDTDVQW